MKTRPPRPKINVLYGISILGSGVGFATLGAVSKYGAIAFTDEYFSIALAFYFLGLGLGSLGSRYWKKPGLDSLWLVVGAQSFWGVVSLLCLRWGIGFSSSRFWLPTAVVTVAGFLAGAVIPLTLRVGSKLRTLSLARLWFFGHGAAGVLALLLTLAPRVEIPTPALPGTAVLFDRQSPYQKIVLTESTSGADSLYPGLPQHSLYLDGVLRFGSADEQLYHLCITSIPMAAAAYRERSVAHALILGGGDGLAARNLLSSSKVKKITLVEPDPVMLELARSHPKIRMYNLDSLKNPKVEALTQDPFRWIAETDQKFDLILIDFPRPQNLTGARVFAAEFYRRVFALLQPGGFVAIQAGAAIQASVKNTVRAIGFPAFFYLTPRAQDGFVLSTNDPSFEMKSFAKKTGLRPGGVLRATCLPEPPANETAAPANTLNKSVTLPLGE